MYLLAYRNLGIFYENAVNKMLHDIVEATKPEWCVVKGEFTPRGGLNTSIFARWPERRGRTNGKKVANTRGRALNLGGVSLDNPSQRFPRDFNFPRRKNEHFSKCSE